MRICFIPIDNRPVCYSLAKDIVSLDESIEFLIPPRDLLGDLTKTADVEKILSTASIKYGLSGRKYNRLLKLARTIADLDGEEQINADHVAEAIMYRTLDRKYWRR